MPIHFLTLVALLASLPLHICPAAEPFAVRGYYTTFMRSPTFGLPEWKQMIDCMAGDGANFLALWTAGAFRSRHFPVTWRYNAEHKNVEDDFVRDLIDYAHTKGIRVVLGFTPFGYDGTNQIPFERPELKATQKNGEPAAFWGMHSWGYNLCPAQEGSQAFMRDYIHEMYFDFYPNADGLLIESSDYSICYCADCRGKFFDREFSFVRAISEEVWSAKKDAMVIVFPRYFSTREVPGFDVSGSRQAFDPRWSLMFTPHSAQIDDELSKKSRSSLYWNDALTVGTPSRIRGGAQTAREHGLAGYITSCEPFSCIDGPPGSDKQRQKPFHFDWLRDGEMPLNQLLVRVNRVAYREYTANPDLRDDEFRTTLGRQVFGAEEANKQLTDDLLFLQDCWFSGADWFTPTVLLRPADLLHQAKREKWPPERLATYSARVDRLRQIATRYVASKNKSEKELSRIAASITTKWDAATTSR